MSGESSNKKTTKHWATMLLGLIVAAIFLVAIFTYQVKSTEWAVVTTFGVITSPDDLAKDGKAMANAPTSNKDLLQNNGGLFFRWPFPIQSVEKYDRRIRCFDGSDGQNGETLTKDKKNVIVGIYITYWINDPVKFFNSVVDIPKAEKLLNTYMKSSRNAVIGKFSFDQLVNTNPKNMRLKEVASEIKNEIAEDAAGIGVIVDTVGIKTLILPKSITVKVEERMIAERKGAATKYRSAGMKEATIIRAKADMDKSKILAEAKAKAKNIRAAGDAEAAQFYAVFRENTQLAVFLRKLDSLRKIMKTKTTLVLDTDSAPFDLFKMNPEKLGPLKNKKSGK